MSQMYYLRLESICHLSKITDASVIILKIPHNSIIIGIKYAHLLG